MRKILTRKELLVVDVYESGEPLVVLQDAVQEVDCRYEKLDMHDVLGTDDMYLRLRAADRLLRAAIALGKRMPGARLRVAYAYRLPSIQRKYFEAQLLAACAANPGLLDDDLAELAHQRSADPLVAGHPAGAAVDVTIVVDGALLDMGTRIADFDAGDRIRTFFPDISSEQRSNRMLLRSVMMRAGFAPYDGEWWHFSYGDREWAAYRKKPFAIYGPVELERT